MARRWGAIAAGTACALLLFIIFVVIFTPSGVMRGVVERALDNAGYSFRATGFGKALPLGINARNVEIGDYRGVLFRADYAEVRVRLLPLLAGKASLSYSADLGGGRVAGTFSSGKKGEFTFALSRVRLEDIPFFATATGAHVKGDLGAEGSFTVSGSNLAGKGRLEIKGLELSGVKISGMQLPDAAYDNVRGALQVTGGKAVLESATLQGEGIYARISGDFPVMTPLGSSPLNLTLEILPKPGFLEKQKLVFLLLARYLVSPGNYRIPIQGTLARPAIQ